MALQLILIYVVLCTVPLGLGIYLLLAPRRGDNFLNRAFAIFPPVQPEDRSKKLFYQALGFGLVLVSRFYILQIYTNIASPLIHFLRSR